MFCLTGIGGNRVSEFSLQRIQMYLFFRVSWGRGRGERERGELKNVICYKESKSKRKEKNFFFEGDGGGGKGISEWWEGGWGE